MDFFSIMKKNNCKSNRGRGRGKGERGGRQPSSYLNKRKLNEDHTNDRNTKLVSFNKKIKLSNIIKINSHYNQFNNIFVNTFIKNEIEMWPSLNDDKFNLSIHNIYYNEINTAKNEEYNIYMNEYLREGRYNNLKFNINMITIEVIKFVKLFNKENKLRKKENIKLLDNKLEPIIVEFIFEREYHSSTNRKITNYNTNINDMEKKKNIKFIINLNKFINHKFSIEIDRNDNEEKIIKINRIIYRRIYILQTIILLYLIELRKNFLKNIIFLKINKQFKKILLKSETTPQIFLRSIDNMFIL